MVKYREYSYYLYWEKLADFWNITYSPVRLSRGDIKIFRSFLKNKNRKNRKILILGSTPELRDIVAQETGARIYLADFSCRMLAAMLKFTANVDPLKEIWVKANWLDLPFSEGFFDLILGDLVLQQLPPHLEKEFLKKMQFILKKDGCLISRCQFLDSLVCSKNIVDLVKNIANNSMSDNQKYFLLKLRLSWLFADPAKRKLNRMLSAKKFAEFVNKNSIDDPLLIKVRDSLLAEQSSFRNWSPPTEEELTKILLRYFTIRDEKFSSDYEESKNYPVFSLVPKV